jgi:hypothetical protein
LEVRHSVRTVYAALVALAAALGLRHALVRVLVALVAVVLACFLVACTHLPAINKQTCAEVLQAARNVMYKMS